MSNTPTIDHFRELINSGADLTELQEALRRRHNVPFDLARISPRLAAEVDSGVETFGMSQQAIFNAMLVALSLACGRYTELDSHVIDGRYEKPTLYCINVARSASGKSPMMKWLYQDTVKKVNREMSEQYERELRQLESNADLKVKEFERMERATSLGRRQCMMNDYTKEAMIQTLRNSASMIYFDELTRFWLVNCPNGPGKKDDNIPNLVTLASDGDMTTLRIGGGRRDVYDAALSIYGHGTLDAASRFFDPMFLRDGTTYRFLFSITEDKDVRTFAGNEFDERLASRASRARRPDTFISLFEHLFREHFMQEGDGFRHSHENRNRFRYTAEGAMAKTAVSRGILDTMADRYRDLGNNMKETMVLKMHAYIDKLALLFHLIRQHDSPTVATVFSMEGSQGVDEVCVDLALDYMRCMFSNWLDLVTMKETNKTEKEMTELGLEKTKSSKGRAYIEKLSLALGGPGEYTWKQFEQCLNTHRWSEKESVHRQTKKRILDAYKSHAVEERNTEFIEVLDDPDAGKKIKLKV